MPIVQQRVYREHGDTYSSLPSISDIYTCKCRTTRIMKDHTSTDWEIIHKIADTHKSL